MIEVQTGRYWRKAVWTERRLNQRSNWYNHRPRHHDMVVVCEEVAPDPDLIEKYSKLVENTLTLTGLSMPGYRHLETALSRPMEEATLLVGLQNSPAHML